MDTETQQYERDKVKGKRELQLQTVSKLTARYVCGDLHILKVTDYAQELDRP